MFLFIDLYYLLIISKWIVQGAAFRTANGKDYIFSANFGTWVLLLMHLLTLIVCVVIVWIYSKISHHKNGQKACCGSEFSSRSAS